MILAIDPGNIQSAYVVLDSELKPVKHEKVDNQYMLNIVIFCILQQKEVTHVAIEMIASYGMAVGASVFDTCVWIGRFYQALSSLPITFIYRKDEKINLCGSMKAKDGNIAQALIDRFAPNTPNKGKGSKKNPGFFYGFAKDQWAAMAVGITYHDMYLK